MILFKDHVDFLLNAARMNKCMPDVFSFGQPYLSRKAGTTGIIVIAADTKFVIDNAGIHKVYDVGAVAKELTTADLDAGAAFQVGKDYYVYLCDALADNEVYKISLASTFPAGYNANSSRKVGGFHYGYERVSITVADVREAIVPNSVWDLKHRPTCSPEGMVYLGGGSWVDIYLPSVNEAIVFSNGDGSPITAGTCKSTYNSTPLTGTEKLNAYNFSELARRSGKRLVTLSEWLQAAHGHPAGDQFAGNVTTRGTTGEDADIGSISLANVVDCARKLYQWVDEFILQEGAGVAGWQDEMTGLHVGQIYEYGDNTFRQILAGGSWNNGADAGSRCVNLNSSPRDLDNSIGARLGCDSL